MSKRLMIKPEKCLGCRICEIICSYNKGDKKFNPRNAAVSVIINGDASVMTPLMCRQCKDEDCIKACPAEAIFRDKDGVVKVDQDKCTQCEQCVEACTKGGISLSPALNKIIKCDLCGGDPSCAKSCPTGTLVYAEEEAGWETAFNNAVKTKEAAK